MIPAPNRHLERLAATALILLAAGITFLRNRAYGLVGTDTYPLILASRVRSPGELVAAVAEPMGGDHLTPIYYRPLLHLTLALDYAIGGLDPAVYQLTSVLIFAGAGAALYLAAERLLTGPTRLGALVALVVFLVHPVHAVVVPDVSRRPELLSVLFMALAVAAQVRATRSARRLPIAPAVFAAAALLSKETALMAPALCMVVAWVAAPPAPWRRRLLGLVRPAIPLAGVLLAVLGLRLAVLGDALAPRPFRTEALVVAYASMLGAIGERITSAGALVQTGSPSVLALSGLLASLLAAAATAPAGVREAIARAALPGIVVSLAWIGLCGLVYTVAGAAHPWYLSIPAAGLALGIGALTGAVLGSVSQGRIASRVFAAAGVACVVAFTLGLARFSPLFHEYPDWEIATEKGNRYLERLAESIESAPRGSVVYAGRPPILARPPRDTGRLEGIYVLARFSLAPWARLRFPDRPIRFVEDPAQVLTWRPDEILVVVGRPGLEPSPPVRRPGAERG